MLMITCALLLVAARQTAPVIGEVETIVSGIVQWKHASERIDNRYPTYAPRVIAAPVMVAGYKGLQDSAAETDRSLDELVSEFISANGPRTLWLVFVAQFNRWFDFSGLLVFRAV
jgi:hypothetical protein